MSEDQSDKLEQKESASAATVKLNKTETVRLKVQSVPSAAAAVPAVDPAMAPKKSETVKLKVIRTSTPVSSAVSHPSPIATPAATVAVAAPTASAAKAASPSDTVAVPAPSAQAISSRSSFTFNTQSSAPEQNETPKVEDDFPDVSQMENESDLVDNNLPSNDFTSDESDEPGVLEGVAAIIAFLAVGFATYQFVMDYLTQIQ